MRILVHKNHPNGLIPNPVIMIAESELTSLEEVMTKIPKELEPVIINSSKIPTQSYIMAWKLENGKVSIDLEKAKVIKKDRLRADRVRPLTELDIAFQRALETGADTTAIVAEKQRLRDIPDLVDYATTFEELEAIKV